MHTQRMGARAHPSRIRALRLVFLIAFLSSSPSFAAPKCPSILLKLANACIGATCRVADGLLSVVPKVSLPYRYHFEISELPYLPESMREAVLTALGTVEHVFSGSSEVVGRQLTALANETGARHVIELASGSGNTLKGIANAGPPGLHYFASDLFPQIDSWSKNFKDNPNIIQILNPVSFQKFEKQLEKLPLRGNILMAISSFHQIENKEAREFLVKASQTGSHVLIVEPLERNWRSGLLSLGGVGPSLLAPIMAKNLSIKQRSLLTLYTWALPVVPITFLHDGWVSTTRQRTQEDWDELSKDLPFDVHRETGLGPLKNFTVVRFRYKGN